MPRQALKHPKTFGAELIVIELPRRCRRVREDVNPAGQGVLLHPLTKFAVRRERLIEGLADSQQLPRIERSQGEHL